MIAEHATRKSKLGTLNGKEMEFAGKLSRPETFEDWARGAGQGVVVDVADTLSALGLSSRENRAKDKIWTPWRTCSRQASH